MEVVVACPHCLQRGRAFDCCTWYRYEDIIAWILQGRSRVECAAEGKRQKVPIATLGEDLALDYVRIFTSEELAVEKNELAKGGFGVVFRARIRTTGENVVVKGNSFLSFLFFFFFFFRLPCGVPLPSCPPPPDTTV
jgi:hypothetical protein